MNNSNQINKVITKSGDLGFSDLPSYDDRVSKSDMIFECIGAIDEANSYIGLAREMLKEKLEAFIELLDIVQNNLFDLTADIIKITHKITEEHINYITEAAQEINQELPPLKSFVIPKGPSSSLHVARVNVRRAERQYWRLHKEQTLDADSDVPYPGMYLNRLSDLLFILGRRIHHDITNQEEIWNKIQ